MAEAKHSDPDQLAALYDRATAVQDEGMAKAAMRREIHTRTQHLSRRRLHRRLKLRRAKAAFFHTSQWVVLPPLPDSNGGGDDVDEGGEKDGESDGASNPKHRKSHKQVIKALHEKYGPCAKYWMHSCAIIDVFAWIIYLILFTTYVQSHVLSSPEAESAMSRQMKQFAGGPENLGDIQNQKQLYDFLGNTLIPNLAPEEATAAMRKFNVDYSAQDPSLHSINGKLFVLENRVWIRQERCSSAATCRREAAPEVGEKGSESWTFNATNAALPAKCQVLQQSPEKRYEKDITSATRADIRGHPVHFSGSGFVEHINLRLGRGTTADNFTAAMQLTRECAQHKLHALRASGWIDDLTRTVSVEYCVAPWFAVPHQFTFGKTDKFLFQDKLDKYESFDTGGACQRLVFFVDLNGFMSGIQATMTAPIRVMESSGSGDDPHLLLRGTWVRYAIIIISCITFCVLKEGTELAYACHDGMVRTHYLNVSNLIWNVLDLVNIVSLVWALVNFPVPEKHPFGSEFSEHYAGGMETYARFERIEHLNEAKGAFGMVVLFWFFRGVEYMRLMPWFQLPINAMANSFTNLLSFGAFFMFIMWGASVAFRFFFATTSDEYTTLGRSLTTLGLGSLGEMNYGSVLSDYRFKSIEVFSIAWAFVAAFVLLTMFVAIVDQGFQDAKENQHPDPVVGEEVVVSADVQSLMSSKGAGGGGKGGAGRTRVKDNQGHVIEYEGHVEKVNEDGTFDVKFSFAVTKDSEDSGDSPSDECRLDDNEKIGRMKKTVSENFYVGKTFSGAKTYRDRNLAKEHVRSKHPRDLSDGVLIALLREDVHLIRTRFHMRGVVGLFVGWPRLLDRLGCRPLRASPGDKKMHKLWEEHMKRYICLRMAVDGFLEAKDWEYGWKDAKNWEAEQNPI